MTFSFEYIARRIAKKIQDCFYSNTEFNISALELKEMFSNNKCAYSGRTMSIDPAKDTLVTFERINPDLGYISGNTCLVCKRANQQKAMLDAFYKDDFIPLEMKIKLMRKALYQLEKKK